MNKRQLTYFIEVYNQRSYKKAAEYFIITPQGINKTIKSLEDELSCKLFVMEKNKLVPTKEADELYPHAVSILKEFNYIEASSKDKRKTITIYSVDSIIDFQLSDFFIEFYRKHPNITLKIMESTDTAAIDHLKRNECDFAILQEIFQTTTIESDFLFEDPFVLVVNVNSPLAKFDCLEDDDFANLTLAGRGFDSIVYNRTMNFFSSHNINTTTVLESNNHKFIANIVENNVAAAFLSETAAAHYKSDQTKIIKVNNNIVNDRISISHKTVINDECQIFLKELKEWVAKNKNNQKVV